MTMRLHDHVTLTHSGDGTVLLDERAGQYYQLNATASLLLTALLDGATATEAARRLATTYPGSADRAATDTASLIASLSDAGLLNTS
jgi:hypothetical protein